MSYFINTAVNIEGNKKLRKPQIEAYIKIREFFSDPENKEALVVLPTGTGKSGLISISPFGVCKKRTLIVTPGLVTKDSIRKTQEVLRDNFWINFDVIFSSKDIPVVNEYLPDISDAHLNDSHIVYSNIHRLVGDRKSSLLNRVGNDFFDFIIIDEAHHAPAQSWRETIGYFSNAKILHVTGTPYRGDNQEVPGKKIHETPLSEVMRDRYVKWLRKETVNASELYFYTQENPGVKLSKDEVLLFRDKDWIEKSVALSPECSRDVISRSIDKLNELRQISKTVPHKILAVGCSISHANDLFSWYQEQGLRCVIVHSDMGQEEQQFAFRKIENNECDVVVSVSMLMEGYDHKYLTILAIFRPYRSINAFAQVVGRILRAIPENEITAFEIDNNGLVIFHEEIGLNVMWDEFQREVDRAKRSIVREYSFTEREYIERDSNLASIDCDGVYVSNVDSYLEEIDFNDMFERKRAEISDSVNKTIEKIYQSGVALPEDVLEKLKSTLVENEMRAAADIIDPELVEKRPALARRKLREILTAKIQDGVANLLIESGLGEKSSELYINFNRYIPGIKTTDANDGILVRYINAKLAKVYGPVAQRDNKTLLNSVDALTQLLQEVKGMIS